MDTLWQMRRYCPNCREPVWEFDFQLEGELSGPASHEPWHCHGCGWRGTFGQLAVEVPAQASQPDFQI